MGKLGRETLLRTYGVAVDVFLILAVMLFAALTYGLHDGNPVLDYIRRFWLTVPSAAAFAFLLRTVSAKRDRALDHVETPFHTVWVYWALAGFVALWCISEMQSTADRPAIGPFIGLLFTFGFGVGEALHGWVNDPAARRVRPSRH